MHIWIYTRPPATLADEDRKQVSSSLRSSRRPALLIEDVPMHDQLLGKPKTKLYWYQVCHTRSNVVVTLFLVLKCVSKQYI
ncbi:hypothetical protein SETIT_9G284700v2 [Setaria italica]|uniref:Uncharacterized protein n=2 Tax=Setaria TaxID=4554 RepID=A0A368SLU0_SETIT|nr:hypothetical protein SETIT_9G284700v2 [Setaria italica]TKV94354.1 hypothetical protein SEVIR_9G288900v2 [Setaria viridis]